MRRIAGFIAFVSAGLFVVSAILEATAPKAVSDAIRIASLVLLCFPVIALARSLAARAFAVGAAVLVLSLLLWASSGYVLPWRFEWAYVALSGIGWLLMFPELRASRPRFAALTLAVGIAALADALVTAREGQWPPWTFIVLGVWKLPLQAAWTIALGFALRDDIAPRAPTSRSSRP